MDNMNRFLARYKENADMNQYWYSKATIDFMANEVELICNPPQQEGEENKENEVKKAVFLSTPSIYFSLKDKKVKENAKNLDYDTNFGKRDANFQFYDFNKADEIPKEFHNQFDIAIIDPPFITREVWEKYAVAAKMLLKPDGHILGSTIDENEEMIKELTGASRKQFRPSIPNLVYQYSLYATFDSEGLNSKNPEIPDM